MSHCHEFKLDPAKLDALVAAVGATYRDGCGVNCDEKADLPRRQEILAVLNELMEILFPGFEGTENYRLDTMRYNVGRLLDSIYNTLTRLAARAFCHACGVHGNAQCRSTEKSEAAVMALLESLPELREIAKLDVAAALTGDPAASSKAEIIISYPCIKAIVIQRIAHVLYLHKVPLIPRMMTEYAHSETGIDINPGARLGKGIFIDHGTGVVIGETAVIGDNVRIYQGVTLGALSFPKDSCGMLVKGLRRHPTIEDNVTIYAGATVLGDVTIGHDSIIGGNVWVTESLPPGTKVSMTAPENRILRRNEAQK